MVKLLGDTKKLVEGRLWIMDSAASAKMKLISYKDNLILDFPNILTCASVFADVNNGFLTHFWPIFPSYNFDSVVFSGSIPSRQLPVQS